MAHTTAIDVLLKICGLQTEPSAEVSGFEFVLRNSAWMGWLITLLLVLAGLTWLSYRDTRDLISDAKRRLLIGLRILLYSLLLLLLLRPVLAFTLSSTIRRTLLTLVDSSGSMRIQDPRIDQADLKRAAIARGMLHPAKGLDQKLDPTTAAGLKLIPRVDVMRSMLQNPELKLLPTLGAQLDLGAYTFGRSIAEVPDTSADWLAKLQPQDTATALGDSLRELLNRKRGQPLAGVFLVTDGASNYGAPALEAANLARQDGVPLFIYAVGITSPRDIIVASLLTQEVAFVKDELPVTVRVHGQGLKGEQAKLVLRLVPANSKSDGEVVAEKELNFGEGEDQVISLPFKPQNVGDYELRASVTPRDDEASVENNQLSQRLRVVDSKVRVLYVETAPRWEFRYLQSLLMRDRRLEAKFVLLEGDPAIAEGPQSPYLAKVPATREDLFKYDLIIVGDVAAAAFNAVQAAALEEFVQKFGGSMLFVAGPRANPANYGSTVFEKLLPVELDRNAAPGGNASAIVPELTPQGRANPLFKFAATEEEHIAAWSRFGRLYWSARVLRGKPAAQVLLVDADATRANKYGKQVLAAFHQYGLGQVLYMGTDNTWRWRRNTGEEMHTLLWGQITQKLGLHHLLGGSKRTQLTVDKQTYTTGEHITVYARLYGADFAPMKEPSAAASYTVRTAGGPSAPQNVLLRAVPDQPGMYRGEFVAVSPGVHQFSVKSDPTTVLELDVTEPNYESGETAMNETLLRQMADTSGGAFFREEDLHKLPGAISSKAEKITSKLDGELWSSPLYFLLLLIVGSTEWLLRKRWHLK